MISAHPTPSQSHVTPAFLSQPLQRSLRGAFALLVVGLSLAICLVSSLQGQQVFSGSFSGRQVENMKASVGHLLTLSEEELRARVPVESGGIWFTDCPNCDFGSQDRGRFRWEPENPHRIECEGCGEVYPGNAKYPDNRYIEVEAPEGTHRFYYWQNPETGYRIFFQAHADYLHLRHLEAAARDLGRLYTVTGEDQYARPAAILLHRMAEVLPGYAYTYDFPYREKLFSPYHRNRIPRVPDYRTSLWTRWAYNDISVFLLEAYDHLHDWDGWGGIGDTAARTTIERDLFTRLVEFVLGFEDPLTNMSPRIWRGAIYAGRILNRPEWVHESIARFERMLEQQFLYDGHWYETSPSYHAMTINGMRSVMAAANGHTDPPGYRHPRTGRRFDELDLARDVPQYGLAIRALEETRLPNGRLLPVNDTWASERGLREQLPPRETAESLLLPGLGVAILAAGRGEGQVFSWLNFTSGTAHKQRDTLSFGLFGHGEEVLPDLGYTHTRYRRAWASSMMAHNTVVVDGRESEFDSDHSGNRPVAFATNGRNFHLAAAESRAAYPEQTERYRRTLILLGESASDAYLLDIFEVQGGAQHDYLLHGSADADSTASLRGTQLERFSGTLVNPGAVFRQPVGEHDEMGPEGSFSFIRDLQRGAVQEELRLDLRLVPEPDKGSRTLIAALPGAEVFLGRSPSIRRANESDALLDEFWMPSLVLRRKGQNLNSVFVAAHEAVDGHPRLQSIRTRQMGDRLWISVTHAGGRDYVSLNLNRSPGQASFDTAKGTFTTDAIYAAVRLDRNDAIVSSHLVEGQHLQFRNHRLSGPGAFRGTVRQVVGQEAGQTVFHLDRNLATRNPGLLMIEFPDGSQRGYSVLRVEPAVIGSRVHVREARGFEIRRNEIAITSYPQRTIEGSALRYRLIDAAHSE